MSALVDERSCWVEIDEKGAVRGVSMPDGTPVPNVSAVELHASVDAVQSARVTLHVRVRQDGAKK